MNEATTQMQIAVKEIGKNVTGVQGDAGSLADLDRLFDMVKKEKGHIESSLQAPVLASSITLSAPLPRKASTIRSMSTFAGPCLPCKTLCRS
jgi:hypothetical protein